MEGAAKSLNSSSAGVRGVWSLNAICITLLFAIFATHSPAHAGVRKMHHKKPIPAATAVQPGQFPNQALLDSVASQTINFSSSAVNSATEFAGNMCWAHLRNSAQLWMDNLDGSFVGAVASFSVRNPAVLLRGGNGAVSTAEFMLFLLIINSAISVLRYFRKKDDRQIYALESTVEVQPSASEL